MSRFIPRKVWQIPEKEITPETIFQDRRHFLKLMGFAATSLAGALVAPNVLAQQRPGNLGEPGPIANADFSALPRVEPNPDYSIRRPLTTEQMALKYNNFYEFSPEKENVWQTVGRFQTRPWEIKISGQVEKPGVYDIDDLMRSMPLEERTYRMRCVEAWAMVVPWYGFPLQALMDKVQPKGRAKHIRFKSFFSPEVAPGQKKYADLPWPYSEGLTLQEAENELTFLAIGIYGHTLPPQHGGPIRLVAPWKYGYKSIKSINEIEFTETQPASFWNTIIPEEYSYQANVDPGVAHPRWSQRREKMLGTGEVYATQKYNGYGDQVSYLYK